MADLTTLPITAFADEISPDLTVQVDTLRRLGLQGLDLRSVGGVNVLDLTISDLDEVNGACRDRDLVVQSVGSPVNKVACDVLNEGRELDRLNKAIKQAQLLNVKRIRIFTPEAPEGEHEEYAQRVLQWMGEQKRRAEGQGVILLIENDAQFWSAYPENAKRLFGELGGESFRAAFDFANAALLGYPAMDHWFPWIVPHLDTLHIKDGIKAEGRVVPAGEGDGQIAETLRLLEEQGWEGTLTLEPHLKAAGTMGGFSGEQLFEVAVDALRKVLAA